MEDTIEYKNLYKKLEEENNIEDISYSKSNSFVLIEENKNIKGYISNINTNAIRKRKII